jgi:hypothetical protein
MPPSSENAPVSPATRGSGIQDLLGEEAGADVGFAAPAPGRRASFPDPWPNSTVVQWRVQGVLPATASARADSRPVDRVDFFAHLGVLGTFVVI